MLLRWDITQALLIRHRIQPRLLRYLQLLQLQQPHSLPLLLLHLQSSRFLHLLLIVRFLALRPLPTVRLHLTFRQHLRLSIRSIFSIQKVVTEAAEEVVEAEERVP